MSVDDRYLEADRLPHEQLLRLDGQVAVVAGGAGGIGIAIATRLAEAGARIVIGDIEADVAMQRAARLTDDCRIECTALPLDVRFRKSVEGFGAEVVARLGRIDVWVNAAGIMTRRPLLEMNDEDWDLTMDVNLRGSWLCSREAARHMVALGNPGVIINIASISGLRARPLGTAYVTSKHGLIGLTKMLALELGPDQIRVLAIAPTLVDTERQRQRGQNPVSPTSRVGEGFRAQHPLGRTAVPDDIARVALFCASELSSMMTGTVLVVDGGLMSWA